MKTFQRILLAAMFAAITGSGSAIAADNKDTTGVVEHRGELGTVDHSTPKSTRSKGEVRKELDEAHKAGLHQTGGEGGVIKDAPAKGKSKTRKEVKAELEAAHKAGTHQTGGDKPQN